MQLLIILYDNPYLTQHIKPAPKSKAYKWGDLTRHLSVIGGAVLMMAAPSIQTESEEEVEENNKKRN